MKNYQRPFIYCLIWLSLTAIIVACNSSEREKLYSISIENNNLYITMPYPTIGIAGINQVSWRGADLEKLSKDVFNTLKRKHLADIYSIYVRFDTTSTDKYGNEEESYHEVFLFEVPIEEVRKYKDYKYFSRSYDINGKLYEAAFGKQEENDVICLLMRLKELLKKIVLSWNRSQVLKKLMSL